MNRNNKKGLCICLAMLTLAVFLVMSWFNGATAKKEAEYDLIIADFLEDRVGEYQLDFNTRTLTYTLWEDMPDPGEEGESSWKGDGRTKTCRLLDDSLFISDVHAHCMEYNEQHPDRPIRIVYIGYREPSFLTTWLSALRGLFHLR